MVRNADGQSNLHFSDDERWIREEDDEVFLRHTEVRDLKGTVVTIEQFATVTHLGGKTEAALVKRGTNPWVRFVPLIYLENI